MGFKLGQTLITKGINETMKGSNKFRDEISEAFIRYTQCDWGQLCEEDKKLNEEAIALQERILAKYDTSEGDIYIITEWDRSSTTILFTHEY